MKGTGGNVEFISGEEKVLRGQRENPPKKELTNEKIISARNGKKNNQGVGKNIYKNGNKKRGKQEDS